MNYQNHIHMALTLGGLEVQYAPVYQWKATQRIEVPNIALQANRSLTGKLRLHTLTSGGNVVKFTGYKYQLKLNANEFGTTIDEKVDILKDMHGKTVYFIDHLHCNDNEDHTPYVVQMGLVKLGEFQPFTQAMLRFLVEVELEPIVGVT